VTDPGTDTGSESNDTDGESDSDRRSPAAEIAIETPSVETAERLAAWWVVLANEQRAHGSHLLGEPNGALIKEAMARHIVTDGLLVARTDPASAPNTPDGRTIGAEGKGEGGGRTNGIVGFVMFGPETGSYDQSVDRGIIENVYVHADYRDRGIGGALLAAAETALADSGVDTIALEVMAENDAARRFYARRGYRPHRLGLEAPVGDLDGGDGAETVESESDRHSNERGL